MDLPTNMSDIQDHLKGVKLCRELIWMIRHEWCIEYESIRQMILLNYENVPALYGTELHLVCADGMIYGAIKQRCICGSIIFFDGVDFACLSKCNYRAACSKSTTYVAKRKVTPWKIQEDPAMSKLKEWYHEILKDRGYFELITPYHKKIVDSRCEFGRMIDDFRKCVKDREITLLREYADVEKRKKENTTVTFESLVESKVFVNVPDFPVRFRFLFIFKLDDASDEFVYYKVDKIYRDYAHNFVFGDEKKVYTLYERAMDNIDSVAQTDDGIESVAQTDAPQAINVHSSKRLVSMEVSFLHPTLLSYYPETKCIENLHEDLTVNLDDFQLKASIPNSKVKLAKQLTLSKLNIYKRFMDSLGDDKTEDSVRYIFSLDGLLDSEEERDNNVPLLEHLKNELYGLTIISRLVTDLSHTSTKLLIDFGPSSPEWSHYSTIFGSFFNSIDSNSLAMDKYYPKGIFDNDFVKQALAYLGEQIIELSFDHENTQSYHFYQKRSAENWVCAFSILLRTAYEESSDNVLIVCTIDLLEGAEMSQCIKQDVKSLEYERQARVGKMYLKKFRQEYYTKYGCIGHYPGGLKMHLIFLVKFLEGVGGNQGVCSEDTIKWAKFVHNFNFNLSGQMQLVPATKHKRPYIYLGENHEKLLKQFVGESAPSPTGDAAATECEQKQERKDVFHRHLRSHPTSSDGAPTCDVFTLRRSSRLSSRRIG